MRQMLPRPAPLPPPQHLLPLQILPAPLSPLGYSTPHPTQEIMMKTDGIHPHPFTFVEKQLSGELVRGHEGRSPISFLLSLCDHPLNGVHSQLCRTTQSRQSRVLCTSFLHGSSSPLTPCLSPQCIVSYSAGESIRSKSHSLHWPLPPRKPCSMLRERCLSRPKTHVDSEFPAH